MPTSMPARLGRSSSPPGSRSRRSRPASTEERFEGYLIWPEEAIAEGVDIDMWVLEPNGNLFIPYLGSVTPNGTFTNDSWNDGVSFEGYMTNRFVQEGVYKIYANLYADPAGFRPIYDLAWRNGQDDELALLYFPENPSLSLDDSWLNDATPTLEEADFGAYSDLELAALVTMSPTARPALAGASKGRGMNAAAGSGAGPRLTGSNWPAPVEVVKNHRSLSAPAAGRGVRLPARLPARLPNLRAFSNNGVH